MEFNSCICMNCNKVKITKEKSVQTDSPSYTQTIRFKKPENKHKSCHLSLKTHKIQPCSGDFDEVSELSYELDFSTLHETDSIEITATKATSKDDTMKLSPLMDFKDFSERTNIKH